MCGGDWPFFRVMRGIFSGGLDKMGRGVVNENEEAAGGDWGGNLDMDYMDDLQYEDW